MITLSSYCNRYTGSRVFDSKRSVCNGMVQSISRNDEFRWNFYTWVGDKVLCHGTSPRLYVHPCGHVIAQYRVSDLWMSGVPQSFAWRAPGLCLSLKSNWNADPETRRSVFGPVTSPPRGGSLPSCQAGHFYTRDRWAVEFWKEGIYLVSRIYANGRYWKGHRKGNGRLLSVG